MHRFNLRRYRLMERNFAKHLDVGATRKERYEHIA